jgi:sulfoxide reductase heme-binding subunit YedZ
VTANQTIRWVVKPALFIVALVPFARLAHGLYIGDLGADPLAEITNTTGLWTLRFLCVTLLVTPLRRITGWNPAIRFRRMLGLFAFFYGTMHLLIYLVADRLAGLGVEIPGGIFAWHTMRDLAKAVVPDIAMRPYITAGFTAWSCMLLLAITSTTGWIRRLGGRRWQALHRLIYVAAVAGVVHYWWSVKADVRFPERYAVIVAVLLLVRVWWARQRHAAPVASRVRREPATH